MSSSDSSAKFVAKPIMSAICCGTMVNKADGYGVTMFMFPFATARQCEDVLVQSQARRMTHSLLCPVFKRAHFTYD